MNQEKLDYAYTIHELSRLIINHIHYHGSWDEGIMNAMTNPLANSIFEYPGPEPLMMNPSRSLGGPDISYLRGLAQVLRTTAVRVWV